jgi:hypothetical protein
MQPPLWIRLSGAWVAWVSDRQYGGRTRPHDPQAAAKVQAYVVRLREAFYRILLQAQQTQQLAASSNYRDLARFLTGSALGLGVLAKTLPSRQALDGYAAVVLSVLA